jgi:tellurite resistance protein
MYIMTTINYQTALIYVMVVAALADNKLINSKLFTLHELVKLLPLFKGFDSEKLKRTTGDCAALLDQEEGLDAILGLVKEALPETLYDTAYTLACDVSSADGPLTRCELNWLQLLRQSLQLNPLHTMAIEFATRIRYLKHPTSVLTQSQEIA